MGKSYERDGIFGKYTEHYDDEGNKIGESHEREGIFGKYTEHTDVTGNRTGESHERDGVFGSYTEHTDASGWTIGESRERVGIFCDYTEHTDTSGKKTGESHEREGIFGKYTEHTGSGWRSGNKGNRSDSKSSNSNSYSGSGSFEGNSNFSERSGSNKFSGTFGKILLIVIPTILIIWALSNTQKYMPSPNLNSSSTGKQQLRSLLGDDSLVGKAKTWRQTEFYPNIQIMDSSIGNTYYPAGSPIGKESYLIEGEIVEILNIFPNDSESKFTLKVRTNKGNVGYVRAYVDLIDIYGEKGDLLSIYLALPYEYEGDMELVKKDISKFKAFIKKYPNSSFIPEIYHEIQWRQKYLKN